MYKLGTDKVLAGPLSFGAETECNGPGDHFLSVFVCTANLVIWRLIKSEGLQIVWMLNSWGTGKDSEELITCDLALSKSTLTCHLTSLEWWWHGTEVNHARWRTKRSCASQVIERQQRKLYPDCTQAWPLVGETDDCAGLRKYRVQIRASHLLRSRHYPGVQNEMLSVDLYELQTLTHNLLKADGVSFICQH